MQKVLCGFILLLCVILSCDSLGPVNGDGSNNKILSGSLSFRSIRHSRAFICEAEKTSLVVFRSIEDKNTFLDTTRTATDYIGFNSYADSMLVGIIYGQLTSVSALFSIDSIIAYPLTHEIIVHSSLKIPISKMSIHRFHCHFVAIPKSDYQIRMNEVIITNETTTLDVIPFDDLFNDSWSFKNNTSSPNLVVLRDKQGEIAFLDTTVFYMHFEFPEFSSYEDSILVGMIMPEVGTPPSFEIVSLILKEDTVTVNTQEWINLLSGSISDLAHPCHFVIISKEYTDFEFVYNDLEYVISEIED